MHKYDYYIAISIIICIMIFTVSIPASNISQAMPTTSLMSRAGFFK